MHKNTMVFQTEQSFTAELEHAHRPVDNVSSTLPQDLNRSRLRQRLRLVPSPTAGQEIHRPVDSSTLLQDLARSKLPVRKRLKLVPNTTAEQVHRPVDNSTLHVLQDLARLKQRLRLAPTTVILYHYTMKFYTVLLVLSLAAQTNAAAVPEWKDLPCRVHGVQGHAPLDEAKDVCVKRIGVAGPATNGEFEENVTRELKYLAIKEYAGTAEKLWGVRNLHWEMLLKCRHNIFENDYIVNLAFGRYAPGRASFIKAHFQGKGMLWVQTIKIADLENLDPPYVSKDFKSPITKTPVIPNEEFYNNLKWQACDQEETVFDLISYVRGKEYSILANTISDSAVHNCQTMTEEIDRFCKGDKVKKKEWGKGKKIAWAVGSTLANLTGVVPVGRLSSAYFRKIPKYMISKDAFISDETAPLSDDKADT